MGRVCVIGAGSSGIASCQVLDARGIPFDYLFGRPTDHLTLMRMGTRVPLRLQRSAVALLLRMAQGNVASRGLPKPAHRLLCGPPTVSDSLLGGLERGDIAVKPAIDRLDRDRVHFTDGTAEQVDTVIYSTGYNVSVPFLDPALIGAEGNRIPLYHRVVPPRRPGLYFIGLVQPIGAVMPITEMQSHWVADLLQERATLPPEPVMDREIAGYFAVTARRYAHSGRPAIQVDFLAYLREIARERRAHAIRNRARRALAPHPPAPRPVRQPLRLA